MAWSLSNAHGIAAIVLAVAGSCCNGDSVLQGRSYVGEISSGAVLGRWSPVAPFGEGPKSVLELQADGNCAISARAIQMLLACGHTQPTAASPIGTCGWSVQGRSGEQWLAVTFRAPQSGWVLNHFSVYRHDTTGELALAGTCGEGDAYGLYRPGPEKPVG
jgi:hypothetical protein